MRIGIGGTGSLPMVARIVAIVAVSELVAHAAIDLLGVSGTAMRPFLDVLLLSVLAAPLLYLFVIKEFGCRITIAEEIEKRAELTSRLISLMDNVPGVVYRGAPDWSISVIGAEVKNLTGHAPEEFTSCAVDWRSICHPDDMERVRETFSDAVRRKDRSLRVEYRIKHVDGGSRWLEDRRQLIYNSGGVFTSVEGLLLDITERKAMEDTVRNQFHFLRVLLDAIPTPIFYKDARGIYLGCNKAYEKYMGIPQDRLVGGTVYDIAPKDLADIYRRFDDDLFRQRGSQVFEASVVPADGKRHDVIFSKATFLNPDGSLGGLVGSVLDITDRKRAEEARALLEMAVGQSNEMIMITDADGTIQYVNPAFERVTGYGREETVGRNPRFLQSGRHDKEFYREMWDKLARGETWSGRMINKKETGELFEEEASISPVRNSEGEVISFLGVKRDITQVISLEKQVRTAQRMEAVGTLAGGIAHDFNNALTGIVGFGELLHSHLASDPKALGDLDVIRRCAEQASTLTRQLLTFARRQVIDPVCLDMNRIVRDLLKLLTKVIGEHIQIKTTMDEDLLPTLADPGQMEQILMNLCLNARDAMPAGGDLLIATSEETVEEDRNRKHPYMVPGRYVILTVSDTGTGMDEETRERIFEPFFTTKGPEKGTGLGLSVVYGIVKQHNGFINVYSEPGEGTTFRVYLPAVAADPGRAEAQLQEAVRGGNETILVVEDDGTVRALAERILKEYGYDVLMRKNGEEAVEIFRERKGIDLVLIDVVMPRMGGKEALDRIRELEPGAKGIFMSGYSADAIHDSFVLKQGISFLPKPFGPIALARKVREVLDADGRKP